ncbi:MAG: hypothetical protein KDD46_07730, partial [Bdellovibrionales bacterium]|nr:hypothetical protein [Bdellovibrionales bacterium]
AIVTDRKVEQYYLTYKDQKFLNRSLSEVRDLVVEDYKKMVLQVEFKKWLDQEKRRQKWDINE